MKKEPKREYEVRTDNRIAKPIDKIDNDEYKIEKRDQNHE